MKARHCVSVIPRQGRTVIAVNGRPLPGMSYTGALFRPDASMERYLHEAIAAGIQIIFVPWHFHRRENLPPGWTGPNQYDFSLFDFWAQRTFTGDAGVWIIPRLYIDTPPWWAKAYPEELVRYADDPAAIHEPSGDHGSLAQASMASEQWIADSSDVLRAFVDHVEKGPWADRVLGYMLNSGGTGEWVYWGAQQGHVADYSTPALRYYRKWLHLMYGDQAWIRQAAIPSEEDRRRPFPYLLRDPVSDRTAIDFDRCFSDMAVDNFLAWCRVVKEATERRRLTGSFCSYLLWQTGLLNSVVNNAHVGLARILASPDVDFLTGITSYDNREPGGPGSFMLPVESIQRAGKLVFNEVDVRTHLTKGDRNSMGHAKRAGLLNLWPLRSAKESIDVVRREFANQVIHGASWWYFDLAGGWYSCPELLDELRKQAGIAAQALQWDLSSVAEVAGVVSVRSPACHRLVRMHDMLGVAWTDLQCDRSTSELYRAGLPIDWWMTDDLACEPVEQYRVLYFHNPTTFTPQEQDAIHRLRSGGRLLVFVGYPGLSTPDGLNVENAGRVAGIRFRLADQRAPAKLEPSNYDHPYFLEIESECEFGTGALVGPRLIPDDGDAEVLATWPDGLPAATIKHGADWTSVYFPVPPNNAAFFRALCRTAGCHVYSANGDVIFANRSLLAVHFSVPNHFGNRVRRIHLPQPARVTDLFTGAIEADGCDSFNPKWEGGGTRLYRVETTEKRS